MTSRNQRGNSVRRGYLFHFDALYMGDRSGIVHW